MTHFLQRTLGAVTLSIAAASILTASAPANAQPQDDAIRVTVSYGDLNLARADGAKVLLQRIQAAADRACGEAPDVRLMSRRAFYDACRAHAVAAAVTDVGSPTLTAMAGPATRTRLADR
jgi:UrcA family protein